MPTTQSDYDQIEAARNKVSNLTTLAGNQTAGVATFRDEVMDRVRNARAERGMSTLSQDLGNATTQLALGRSQIRERTGDVVNPLQVDQIGERQRSFALGNLASISNTMGEREGTLEESIQSGANTLQASALRTKAQADAAQLELSSLMDVVRQKQQEAQQMIENAFNEKQLEEQKRQFNIQENRLGRGSAKEPDKYGDNEITRAAGLVGMPITPDNNDKIAYEQYLANERAKKAATSAQIKAAQEAGMVYNPKTDTFEDQPGLFTRIQKKLFGK